MNKYKTVFSKTRYDIPAESLVWLFQYEDTSVPGKYTSSHSTRQRYITELPVTYFSEDVVSFITPRGKWIHREMQQVFGVDPVEFIERYIIFRLPLNNRNWDYLVIRMTDIELSEVEIKYEHEKNY